jgi:small-conductance mechanosensitive channel
LRGQESGVPVIVDGREIVRVYGPAASFSAQDRAAEITHRITILAEKGYAGKIGIRAIPTEKATGIVAGPSIVMAVTELDAESAGAPQEELARRYAESIQTEIADYRERHSLRRFLLGVLKALLAWSLFIASFWAVRKILQWFDRRLEGWFTIPPEAHGTNEFVGVVRTRGRRIGMTMLKFLAGFALVSEFSLILSYTFGLFPQTAGVSSTLLGYLAHTFGKAALAVVNYLPSGGFVILAVLVTYYVLKGLKLLALSIERGDFTVKSLHPEMARPTYQLARAGVILFALVVIFPYLPGGNSEAFKGVSIFLGVLLSFGSSSAVSNVLAGLVLTYMRAFHAGDRVKIADTVGDVVEKTLLVTRVRTIKNVEVVIPNSAILNSQVLNYSALARTRGLILHTTVTIGYDAPWRTVHDLLTRAALRTENILQDPRPFVLETSLDDSYISYELNAYTDQANEFQNTYSRLHEAIQDSFNQAGVEIMSPSFYALRDGNAVTIPVANRAPDYDAPSFRVQSSAQRTGPTQIRRSS